MKFVFYLVVFGLATTARGGAATNGSPAALQNLKIIWAVASTNNWPDKIWSYKVVPQEFSPVVISNVMEFCSLTSNDLKAWDKGSVEIHKGKKTFRINSSMGYMFYFDESVLASPHGTNPVVVVTGVPNQDETLRLGLKYLRLLGIDISEIATKPGTCDLDLHWERRTYEWTDQKTEKDIEVTNSLAVMFTRRIDGISANRVGQILIGFGNQSKVSDLVVSWRNLKPHELLDNFDSPEQIVNSIRAGQISLPRLAGPISKIKALIITNAMPLYDLQQDERPMDLVLPCLRLDAIVDNGKTNRSIWFQTSIFSSKSP
jgi:hypothetical protein